MYLAHINEITHETQSIQEHSNGTAQKAKSFARPPFDDLVFSMGMLHDIGKYQEDFQKRIRGANIRVEHSICGAQAIADIPSPLRYMAQYCIAGHHSGLPDGGFLNDTPDMPTLNGRLKRISQPFDTYKTELSIPAWDDKEIASFLIADCHKDMSALVHRFAFFTRYCFSCLTDADSLDTAEFMQTNTERTLHSNFENCFRKLQKQFTTFSSQTTLQKTRTILQEEVFSHANEDAELYCMQMPTGSGKTLCSMQFALMRAKKTGKNRIIYIIPYNSIIDQTAQIFTNLFGDDAEILRHQSTFCPEENENLDEAEIRHIQLATENWDAQIIITTAVQFFQSLYSNKRSQLRKLHHIADSILIFDEVHLLPISFLQPCLEGISFLCHYLGSEAIFLTATMPNFPKLLKKYVGLDLRICSLVSHTEHFSAFEKCQYALQEHITIEHLLHQAEQSPASLIIVNQRKTAREVYATCNTKKKYHLSTYMTPVDRMRMIMEIKTELAKQSARYPNPADIPKEEHILVVSTSLIEAGVDLDFMTVFRELTGLDSVLQAGGRCNREGKQTYGQVVVFSLEDNRYQHHHDMREEITKGLFQEFPSVSALECIDTYYERWLQLQEKEIEKHSLKQYFPNGISPQSITSIPFRQYAEDFSIISSHQVSVVISQDEKSNALVTELLQNRFVSERSLQQYMATVSPYDLQSLAEQHAVKQVQNGVWVLTNPAYYQPEIGIVLEATDIYLD